MYQALSAQTSAARLNVDNFELPATLGCRGDGGFRLAGSKIARAPLPAQKLKKKKEKEKKKKKAKVSGETAAAADEEHEAPAAGAAAAAAGAGPAKKKRKQQHGAEGSAAAEQQLEAGTAPAHGEPEQKKKEKKKKRKAGEGPEQQEEPQEQQQQEQQEEEEPQSRKKKKRKTQGDGKGAAAAAAAAPRGWEDEQDGAGVHGVESGDKERDTAGMPWRQNNSRKKVKSGAFSKAEKDAIKRAGARGAGCGLAGMGRACRAGCLWHVGGWPGGPAGWLPSGLAAQRAGCILPAGIICCRAGPRPRCRLLLLQPASHVAPGLNTATAAAPTCRRRSGGICRG